MIARIKALILMIVMGIFSNSVSAQATQKDFTQFKKNSRRDKNKLDPAYREGNKLDRSGTLIYNRDHNINDTLPDRYRHSE